jgi:hypothetical protein
MAITLQQIDRTELSVTFSVSGITNDRATFIWIPDPLIEGGGWLSLDPLKSTNIYDFIDSSYSTNPTNGDITVYLYPENVLLFPIWEFVVINYIGEEAGIQSEILDTIVKFDYENTNTKSIGNSIDITVADLRKINLIGSYIDSWINLGEGTYYPLNGVTNGDRMFADYLLLPTQNIHDTATALTSTKLPDRTFILAWLHAILNGATGLPHLQSGEKVYATYFNNIKNAINNFNLSV